MHTEHQDCDYNRTDDDPPVYRFAVFIRDTAHRSMRQANHAKAHQYPERRHKGRRQNIVSALWRNQLRIDGLQRVYRIT